ncbi:Uncharacterized protein PRO82_002294 [Candidatus Protochlamydia amoebophila]|uniref:CHAT domain-containing tetratricopeptide repeat protein n=1 Tax=Candidatus Protochlamydia amoebophila TaxID=362787 RepID=UPI001BCA022C|nr:CHAT domain-containing tetratricopeptide repeat protein [Candidatus Protochlamydia amoebophila]MBS4164952.1 Uncharacterized protein [Candidatus Protochlamydia amoebophila]
MNINSIESGSQYNSLSFQNSPIISTLDHVKDVIEVYKTKFITEEDIITCAKLLIEEIVQLEDIGVKRECFCRLLTLEIAEIQYLLVEEVALLFDFRTFFYDIQHDQAQQLIQLEGILSEIIEAKLNLNQLNFLFPICTIYQDILEHLWLLPYFEFGNHCSHLIIQNKDAILSHMERWKESLDQLASEEKISHLIPKSLENSVLRLFEPLPEVVAKEIEEQKTVIHKSREMTLRILEIIANFYGSQGDYPRAIFYAEFLFKILTKEFPETFQNREELVKIMQIHGKLAVWNQILRQYERTIFYSIEALRIARELGDTYKEFIYSKDLAYFYFRQGQSELALLFYKEAQTMAIKLQDPKSESQALVGLANAYLFIDKNKEAIQCYQDALNLTEERSEQALIYIGIGQAHANAQCYQPAKKAYHKALELLSQGNLFLEIQIHENLADLFNNFSRYGKAISQAEKILELIQHPLFQEENPEVLVHKFNALTAVGSIYGAIGDYKKELDYKMQALELAKKASFSPAFLGIAYTNLGSAYCHMENYPESIKHYIKALEITEECFKRAKILVDLGHTLFLSLKFTDAIEYYKEANAIDNQEIKKHSLLGLGVCYNIMGNKEQAIQCIEKSICLSRASGDCHSEAQGYHNLGEVYRKTDLELAEENYRKSIEIYALLHHELKNYSHSQITFFELQVLPLLRLESLLLKQKRSEEALQVTDFRRSRALVSSLTGKFQFQKIDSLISSELNSQEMQALAYKMKTCFIVYSFASKSKDSITAWVIPPQGKITCKQLSLGILTEEVKETTQVFKTFPFIVEPTVAKRRPFLRPKKTRGSATYAFLDELTRGDPDESVNSAVLQTFKERLSLWYETLITPLESYLPKDPQQVVTIIPDGFLAQIPFAAFLDKEGTYLIEKHPISIAPSIGILKLLDEIPKVFSENSLVIGNPTTPHSKDTLPLAEKEAQTIVAPLLATSPERTLLQDSATAERVLEGMRDARWIHLACHGSTGAKPEEKLDPHSVFEGLFKLAPDEEHIQGYLHAQEIVPLTLRTELVFMSACFSGRGKLHREGSVGPVWSFLAAGALSTIATYWRLPDSDLTLQMVDTFYRHLLGIEVEKLNKAQALQKAMLVGIEQKREKPHLWGAFFLSGLIE